MTLCRGLLRVHHEVFAGGKDVAVKNNFHKIGRFVLSRVSYSGVDVRNMSSVIQSFFHRISYEPIGPKRQR